MSTTRTIGSYLNQQTTQIVKNLQVKRFRAHIRAVLFGGHSFAVVAPGYTGPAEVVADASIDFGTQRRPLVFRGNDCWIEMDDTGRWHATAYIPTNKCSPVPTDVAPNVPLPVYTPPTDTNTINFGGQSYVDMTFTPPSFSLGGFPAINMPSVGTNSYDFGDWLTNVTNNTTVSSVGFESNRAFTITRVAAASTVSDCTLNIYVGTTFPAIVVTAQVDGTWSVTRNDPTTGSLISTWVSGVTDHFVHSFSGTSLLSVPSAYYIKSTLTAGNTTVTDFFWSCGAVA
jgi:hypothetical protein